jgi:hypothetical protein
LKLILLSSQNNALPTHSCAANWRLYQVTASIGDRDSSEDEDEGSSSEDEDADDNAAATAAAAAAGGVSGEWQQVATTTATICSVFAMLFCTTTACSKLAVCACVQTAA